MLNQNTNFLFSLFSLISIFNSAFSLSSHWFVFLQPMFSLSFFFRSPSLTLKSTVRRPHQSSRRPHQLSHRHHFSFEDSITADLKTPLFYVSIWHSHRRSRHADLAMPRDKDRPGSPLITDPLCDEEELQCEGHGGRKRKLPSATATEAAVLIWFSLLKGNKHWRRRERPTQNVSVYVRFNLWF